MQRLLSRIPLLGSLFLATLLAASCTDRLSGPGPDDRDFAEMRVTANVANTPINTLVVEVTAADITTPLVYNLTVQDGVATGTIKMPPGTARTITVKAFDANGSITHQGSVTIDVGPGQNPPVSINLSSSAGHVAITVTFGAASVIVTPAADTIAPGDSLQLTATVLNPQGDTVTAAVEWATDNPALATVSGSGMVTAVADSGQVNIYATHEGIAGFAAITIAVGPPPPPPPGDSAFTWTGAASSDWFDAANWSGAAVPGAADSATVPAGTPNAPVLGADAAIGTLVVADGATVSLGAFDLTANGDVSTGTSGGIASTTGELVLAGTGRTVSGVGPRIRVTGTYSLDGTLRARAPGIVNAGRLTAAGWQLRIQSF